MELVNRFEDLHYTKCLSVTTLEKEQRYAIIRLSSKQTKYGNSVIAALQAPEGNTCCVFLPRRYSYGIKSSDFDNINAGLVKYNLIFKGTDTASRAHILSLELVDE
jgi:hypothetical protein